MNEFPTTIGFESIAAWCDAIGRKGGSPQCARQRPPGLAPGLWWRDKPMGFGVRDGRGYGPYGMGYWTGAGGVPMPYGPAGEKLGPEYDFTPNADGGFIPPRPPRVALDGAVRTTLGPRGRGLGDAVTGRRVLVGAIVLGAGALTWVLLRQRAQKVRRARRKRRVLLYHSRGTQRYMTL